MRAPDMSPGEPDGVATLPDLPRALTADAALSSIRAKWAADCALTSIYTEHYRTLVRLGAFLVRDTGTAEEVVQDSFVAMHGAWDRLRDSDKALSDRKSTRLNS